VSHKNAIIIFTDTWRRDHLGFYGNNRIKTPAADRLASESIIFEDVYPESLATIQVRRAYFTGKRIYPWRDYEPWLRSKDFKSWCYGWQPLAPDDVSITEILRGHGFVSGLIADIPFYCQPAANFHRAFHSYEFIRGKEYDPIRIPEHAQRKTHTENYRGKGFDEDYFAPQVFRSAMKWLEENSWRERFYLHLELWDPHEFWYPPKIYSDIYNPGFDWENKEELIGLINPPGKLTNMSPSFPNLGYPEATGYTPRQIEQIRALYAGMVTQTDFWMGVFLDYARNLGVLDDTIVIFFSDHGTFLGERGVLRKPQYALYDELIRLPLTIRLPDQMFAGKRVEGFIYDHDLTVTLLELLGIEKPDYMEGTDAMPLVTGEKEGLHDYIICGYNDFVCVRDKRWHYIQADRRRVGYSPALDRLYDVNSDPDMEVNIIDENRLVVKRMEERIVKLWAEYGLEYKYPLDN